MSSDSFVLSSTDTRKGLFSLHSIRSRLIIAIGAALAVLLIACALFILMIVEKNMVELAQSFNNRTVEYYTSDTKSILSKEFNICKTLQEAVELYEEIPVAERRDYLNTILRKVLVENEDFVDTWTVWEPNALDGMDAEYADTYCHDSTGRFIPYWTRSGTTIDCVALTDYDGSFWYDQPRNSPKGILIEPNLYEVAGKMIWVCGVAFPIHDSSGKAVGVVGLDMSLDSLSSLLKSAKIYESGYLTLISNDGLVAVGKDLEQEGKIFEDFNKAEKKKLFQNAARTLTPFGNMVMEDGVRTLEIIKPFKVENADQVWYVGLMVPYAEMTKQQKSLRVIIIVIFALSLMIVSSVASFIITKVVREINKGVDAMKNIAQGDGDLTVRMSVHNNDEMGIMYKYFNKTIEKIQTSIAQVKDESSRMDQIGQTLSDNMNDTAAAANQITANIDSINRQIIQQGDNVRGAGESVEYIANNVASLIQDIENQSASVVESSSAIEEMVANIRSVTNILEKNSSTIKELENSSEAGKSSINTSVDATRKIQEQSETLLEASKVIQNIASQTNLLAMNAAIEAAHAGESGKGFSVVADEIRKLAEDSNTQGKKITKNLKEVLKSIREVADSSKLLQEKFNDIYSLTQIVSEQETTIMSAMQEQSEGGGQVLTAMRDINNITVNVKNGGQEMSGAAQTVRSDMNNLLRLTEEITSSMQEMSMGMENINHSINNANDLTHQNSDCIKALGMAVNKFKV